jgi:hypothetical protein
VFEPEILGFASSTLWSLTQALITPTLGFLFLYLMGLPLTKLFFLPDKVEYSPPKWVLPLFTHGSLFIFVAIVSTNVFLNRVHEGDLTAAVSSQLMLTRELETSGSQPTKVVVIVNRYDRFSHFALFANGYHVFSSDRDCVTTFQCTSDAGKAKKDADELKEHRKKGGSLYEMNVTNSLPHKLILNHYLARGRNYIDIISENSGTGLCELSLAFHLMQEQGEELPYFLDIVPLRNAPGAADPKSTSPLDKHEIFHSGGSASGDTIARYGTPTFERRNTVCERIRIAMNLTEDQAARLSSYDDFKEFFLARQKAYVCETIGEPIADCKALSQ